MPRSPRYVHRGATSQDIMDTALALQLRAGGQDYRGKASRARHDRGRGASPRTRVDADARTHLAASMPSPTTFGLKATGWLDMLGRCRARL